MLCNDAGTSRLHGLWGSHGIGGIIFMHAIKLGVKALEPSASSEGVVSM